jgi:hypothetical protein
MTISYQQFLTTVLVAAFLLSTGCVGKSSKSPEDLLTAGFADMRTQISQAISDPDRQAKALELVNELKSDFDILRQSIVDRRERVKALYLDYDTSRAELVEQTNEMESGDRAARKTVASAHRKLVAAMTAEEWAVVAKANTETMKAAIDALMSI